MDSPFSSVSRDLLANGYSPIPIAPGKKAPGQFVGNDWRIMRNWSRYCDKPAGSFELATWELWPDSGVGVVGGLGLVAFDIDQDELIDPILAVLPEPLVAKRGRKGITVFYRTTCEEIRSRGFRDRVNNVGLMDLIAHGKQTVIPPTIHPDTQAPYVWTTPRTLVDTPLADLPEVTGEHYAALLEVMRAHGWRQDADRPALAGGLSAADDGDDFYRRLNNDALANLDAWVPKLGLQRLMRVQGGYRSVAEWRPSYSGKPLGKRERHVSIKPNGIVDFGDGEKGYTPINLVMAALDMPDTQLDKAVRWLGEAIGYDFTPRVRITSGVHRSAQETPTDIQDGQSAEAGAVAYRSLRGALTADGTRAPATWVDADGEVFASLEDLMPAHGATEEHVGYQGYRVDIDERPFEGSEEEAEIARSNVVALPAPIEERLPSVTTAAVAAGYRPHKPAVVMVAFSIIRDRVDAEIDDLLAYAAERIGRPVEIDDAARAQFVNEIALEVAVTMGPPEQGFLDWSAAFCASAGFRRFRDAVCRFRDSGAPIAAAVEEEDLADVEALGEASAFFARHHIDLETIHVPGAVGAIMDWICACSAQPSRTLALAATLPCVGALAGRIYAAPSDLRTNLYCLGLAGSGTGKNVARECIDALMTKGAPNFGMAGGLASGTGLRKRVEGQASVLYQIDEFGQFMRRVNDPRAANGMGQIKDYLMQYFSAASSTFRGTDYAGEQGKPCHNPNVCLYGTSTPVDFWDACGSMGAKDGMLPRWLAFIDERKFNDDDEELLPKSLSSEPPEALLKLVRTISCPKALGNVACQPSTVLDGLRPYPAMRVPFGDGAEKAYLAFKRECKRLSNHAAEVQKAFYNRVNEHATKIALVIAIGVNSYEPVITLETLRLGQMIAATTLCGYLDALKLRLAANDKHREYLHVYRTIVEKGPNGISKTALNQAIGGEIERNRREAIIQTLVDDEKTVEYRQVKPLGFRFVAAKFRPKWGGARPRAASLP